MEYRAKQEKVGALRRMRRFVNGLGRARQCCVCGHSFFRFSRFRGGWKGFSPYLHNVKWTGSDFDNFWCPFCRSHDRERHKAHDVEVTFPRDSSPEDPSYNDSTYVKDLKDNGKEVREIHAEESKGRLRVLQH